MSKKSTTFSSTREIINEKKITHLNNKIYYEFQYFGQYLAERLEDEKRLSLYIKLARDKKRNLLEQALDFVRGSSNVKDKGNLFLWRLKKLED